MRLLPEGSHEMRAHTMVGSHLVARRGLASPSSHLRTLRGTPDRLHAGSCAPGEAGRVGPGSRPNLGRAGSPGSWRSDVIMAITTSLFGSTCSRRLLDYRSGLAGQEPREDQSGAVWSGRDGTVEITLRESLRPVITALWPSPLIWASDQYRCFGQRQAL